MASSLTNREALWAMFAKVVQDPDMPLTQCVLDGLDECDEASQRWLVKKIVDLLMPRLPSGTRLAIRIAIVSRRLLGLERCPRLQLDPDHDVQITGDIQTYIHERVSELSTTIDFEDDFRAYVEDELLSRSKGTFLWVGFAMNQLLEKKTSTEIEDALQSLPEGLPAIYGRMLQQIDPKNRKTCASILCWVALCVRPLHTGELVSAIGVHATRNLSVHRIIQDCIAWCGPLLVVENDIVNLVHQSARDYLLRQDSDDNVDLEMFRIIPAQAHMQLATVCLDKIQPVAICQGQSIEKRIKMMTAAEDHHDSLLVYAVLHWPEHAINSGPEAVDLYKHPSGFFGATSALRFDWQRAYGRERHWLLDDRAVGAAHVACYLGLLPWLKILLRETMQESEMQHVVDARDSRGRTLLHYAARGGHEAIVGFLLDQGADVNAPSWLMEPNWERDGKGVSSMPKVALFEAAEEGHTTIVQLLLDRGAGAEEGYIAKAFLMAAGRGHVANTRLLLHYGQYQPKGWYARYALHLAAQRGHEFTLQLLLDHGVDADKCLLFGTTPLHEAVKHGHEAIVRELLDGGANVNSQDNIGFTALHVAISNGWHSIAQLLLASGPDVDAKDDQGRTALHIAVSGENGSAVKAAQLLLDHGISIHATDMSGATALDTAREYRCESALSLLRDYEMGENMTDEGDDEEDDGEGDDDEDEDEDEDEEDENEVEEISPHKTSASLAETTHSTVKHLHGQPLATPFGDRLLLLRKRKLSVDDVLSSSSRHE